MTTTENASAQNTEKVALPEPPLFSVIGFLHTSPNGLQRAYAAIRDPRGWRVGASTSRIPKIMNWDQLQELFEGEIVVTEPLQPSAPPVEDLDEVASAHSEVDEDDDEDD